MAAELNRIESNRIETNPSNWQQPSRDYLLHAHIRKKSILLYAPRRSSTQAYVIALNDRLADITPSINQQRHEHEHHGSTSSL
mmetsp:Transcript_9199/g.19598  ORF Transcript_9199/g.19598 Transcript_9199/m.19598 type:complete len:83 (-) Transcript_9199:634-882(-)